MPRYLADPVRLRGSCERRRTGVSVSTAAESDFVFNLVLNGTVFRYLRYCIASQLSQSDARFRFVVETRVPPRKSR